VSESELYGELIIEATRLGHRLFRNNVGRASYRAQSGSVYTVPYGVGGVGGSDLLGWTQRVCYTQDGVAYRGLIFTALEVKRKGKKPTKEQQRFLDFIRTFGGIAGVVTSVDDYHKLIGHSDG